METSKIIWRALLFAFIIAALCGSFVLPAPSITVRAAPQFVSGPGEVVISEFRTSGPNGGNDEFIELYNVTPGTIDISGLEVWGSNSTGGNGLRLTISANKFLAPGQHYLIANNNPNGGYSNTNVTADQTYGTGIADDGGIALILPGPGGGTILDQVGMSAGSVYKEPPVLSPLSSNTNTSYERYLGGAQGSCVDNGNNSADFVSISPSDPQNMASSPVYCPGLQTFTPTSTSTSTDTPTPTGTATVTSTSAITSTPTGTTTTGSATNVVISEFRTRGKEGGNDEFIELYNPTTVAIDIGGWKINSSNNSGTSKETKATIPTATLLRPGQYYLIANNYSGSGYSGTKTADLTYSSGIADDGGIALLKADNTLVDQVGMSTGSVYKEGTPLSPLTSSVEQSYERKLGGDSDSCQDTNDNSNDFNKLSTSNPQNYSDGLSLCGVHQPNLAQTTTTITAHSPNPSIVNRPVTINFSVGVLFGSTVPTGPVTVTVSGTTTSCSYTLKTTDAGKGSCSITFTTLGTKTLIATYLGDNLHLKSTSPAVSHSVVTIVVTPTATLRPTPLPPPPLVAINEFVPRPGHDWNHDGVVNTGDEYIELLNHGVINVNLSGYSLDDEVNVGSTPYKLPAVTIKPGERMVFFGSQTGLLLGDGGDGVRLLKPNGQLADAYNYTFVNYPDQSYCRLPDNGGADDWNQNCFPTPGLQNSLSGNLPVPVNQETNNQLYCPIADTLPDTFAQAECEPFGNNIWSPAYWDKTGWYGDRYLPDITGKWPVFVN